MMAQHKSSEIRRLGEHQARRTPGILSRQVSRSNIPYRRTNAMSLRKHMKKWMK